MKLFRWLHLDNCLPTTAVAHRCSDFRKLLCVFCSALLSSPLCCCRLKVVRAGVKPAAVTLLRHYSAEHSYLLVSCHLIEGTLSPHVMREVSQSC